MPGSPRWARNNPWMRKVQNVERFHVPASESKPGIETISEDCYYLSMSGSSWSVLVSGAAAERDLQWHITIGSAVHERLRLCGEHDKQCPLNELLWGNNPIIKCGVKSLIHFQTSTASLGTDRISEISWPFELRLLAKIVNQNNL